MRNVYHHILFAVLIAGLLLPRGGRAAVAHYGDYFITADHIDFNVETQLVEAKGNVHLKSPDGVFTATEATYDPRTKKGELRDAAGGFQPYLFSAREVHYNSKDVMHIDDAALTTCVEKHPHYRFIARRVDVYPNSEMVAHHVTLEVDGHRTITLPLIHGNPLEPDRANAIAHPSQYIGTSELDGYFVATRYSVDFNRSTRIALEGRVGTANLFRGGIYLRHDFTLPGQTRPSQVAFVVSRKEDVENRMVDGDNVTFPFSLGQLALDRTPGVQVALAPLPLPGKLHPFTITLGGSAGYYREEPTGVSFARGQTTAIVSTPVLRMGPLNLYGQYGAATSVAGGLLHLAHAGVITLETAPTFPIYGCLSFERRREAGATPFIFDRVLVPDELISEVEVPIVPGGLFRVDLWNRLDADTRKFRDLGASLILHTDCISYSLSYNLAAKAISGGIVLNAMGNFHHGVGGVAFTQ